MLPNEEKPQQLLSEKYIILRTEKIVAKICYFQCTKKVTLIKKKLNFIKAPRDSWHGVGFPWLYLSLPAFQK